MRGYGQFCPVAMGAEVFAERWTPLILRELLLGSHRFGELLRGVPGIPRSVLTARLARLEAAGIVERRAGTRRGSEWWLTPSGLELGPVIEALGAWGYRHAADRLSADTVDPDMCLWYARRRLRLDRMPTGRIVVQFDFTGPRATRRWLVVADRDVDLCITDPGFEPDVVVTADAEAFARVYLGRLTLPDAIDARLIALDGRPDLVRAFPSWLGVTHFARYRDRPPALAFGG